MADTTLSFNVLAKDNATSTITKIGQKFGALHLGVGKVTQGLAAVGPALAGLAVGAGLTQFVNDARESARVGRLTAQVIKSTGGAARITADQVGDLATAISNKTGADDEAIQSGQNLLLTFTNIRNGVGKGNDIFNQASQAITDMTAAMNGGEVTAEGMKTSSIQLGKALNDPIKGVTALSKVGVSFTQKQKDQIKTLVESGKTMEAQKIILKELGKEFGGAAEAAADPVTKLKTIVGNASEAIGGALLPIVDKGATILGKVIPEAVGKGQIAIEALGNAFRGEGITSDGFIGVMERIGVKARKAFDVFRTSVMPRLREFGGYITGTILPKLQEFAGMGFDVAADATKWAKGLITGLMKGLQEGDWKPLGKAVGDGITTGLKTLGDNAGKLFDELGKLIDKVDWKKLGAKVNSAILGVIHGVDWKGIADALGNALITVLQKSKDLGEKISAAFKAAMGQVDWKKLGHDSTDAIAQFITGVDWGRVAKVAGSAILGSLKISEQVRSTIVSSGADLVEGMISAIINGMSQGREWLVQKTKELGTWMWAGLKSGITAGAKGIANYLKGAIVDPVVNAVKGLFGIHSPSTVFAKIGSELVAGLKGGVTSAARGIGNWVSRVVVSPVVGAFSKAGTWLVQHGKNAVAGFKNGVSSIARGIGGWVSRVVVSPVVGVFSRAGTWLVQAGKNAIAGFKNGISAVARGIGSFVYSNVAQPVARVFTPAGRWLVQAGKNVIAGFKNGMVEIWGGVTKWVSGIATWIKENKGPISLDGKLLIPAGRAIMSGFLKGLKSGAGPAWNFVKSVGGKTVDMLRGEMFQIPADVAAGVLGGPNRRVFYQGEAFDLSTYQKLAKAMSMVGSINVTQGGYEGASSYSGTTHTGGGVFDVVGGNLPRILNALKASGLIGWIRNPSQGPWPWHIHALDPSDAGRMSSSARAQVASYYAGRSGLGGYAKGTPWVPADGPAYLHRGEAVIPRKVNEARLAAGNSAVTRIEIAAGDSSPYTDFLIRELRKYIRVNGGNVQVVLGK